MDLILSDTNIDNIQENDNIKYFDISKLEIKNCVGCFDCWTKTPSKCIIRDDAVKVYPFIAKAKNLIYISKIKFGSYDTPFKTMLERALPIQQPFMKLYKDETHHIQRNVNSKNALIIAYSDKSLSGDEKLLFKKFVNRNSYNMMFESYKILFTNKNDIQKIVESEVLKWKNY